ncbi:hypothetical protein E3N88_04083 [Mikania micrantha]|uniref:Reverse transcriptase Ty1/copia-type domain-containing protein n=1 Tax=Mikania micrantha TaxID=192012 RepID=A0A5N6PTE4_9ASTR|nr:hypothetical protein E3N88_04083 [Mikania micrantha]
MNVKTTFLIGELDEEVYMKQPEGFVLPGQENKINVYIRFDSSGKGVIICLYVDDMLIFGTDKDQIDKTKKLLSSSFDMKDMREADAILRIRIKRSKNGITMTQSHYIEKMLKKFNHFNCSHISTPIDPNIRPMPNQGNSISQLEYSKAIGCLMYDMISTRPDIAYSMGKLRSPSILEGYSDASWITNMENHFSTTLAAAGKEAEWLRNLIFEIPLWSKPISPIFIRCDSAATLAKAYSHMYNGKSRYLGVRHSMIRKFILNGVIYVEFVRSKLNLADHLTKGLGRDLVNKSAIGMGLKSI